MGFLDPDIHKLKNGKYRARLICQDLDETSGNLAGLKLWVESLIKDHGEAAEFEIEHPEDEDGGRASYCIERDATDEEIRTWDQRQADALSKTEQREREEYEKLRAKFEGGGSVGSK